MKKLSSFVSCSARLFTKFRKSASMIKTFLFLQKFTVALAFRNAEFNAELDSVRNVVKKLMRKREKKLQVSRENVMEKLKFITFMGMFNNFSSSNFIWEYFLAFLTNSKSASNFAFFDSHFR
jgi:hypothetical protein